MNNIYYEIDKDNNIIIIYFGKNGLGLTDEFIKIGEFIQKLSEKYIVYIEDAHIDFLDDVYSLYIHYIKK